MTGNETCLVNGAGQDHFYGTEDWPLKLHKSFFELIGILRDRRGIELEGLDRAP
jgi:hypothetical protein